MKNILFYGAGNMGKAVLKGLLASGMSTSQFRIAGNRESSRTSIKSEFDVDFLENTDAFTWADTIVLGIKPQIFAQVKSQLKAELADYSCTIISLMAGTSIAQLSSGLGSQHTIVRTMPNLPLNVGEGAVSICTDGLSSEVIQDVCTLFESAGIAVPIEERLIDSATALAGSAPAFVFQFAEGLIAGGVLEGMPRAQSEALVLQALKGSVKMMIDSIESPSDLTTKVCSPGGTTIAGVYTLEKNNFKSTLMDTIRATAQRSKELGQ